VIMNGRSGVAPATESIWTTLVCATLPPRVKRRSQRMLALPPREQPGEILSGLAGEEQYLFHAREVHHRDQHREVEERRALVLDRDHAPHGQALGEDVPLPGGHHGIAHHDARAIARHELEAHRPAGLPLHDARGAPPAPPRARNWRRPPPPGSPSTRPGVRVRCTMAPTVEAGSLSSCTTDAPG